MKKYLLTTAILVLLVLASGLVSAAKSADEVNELLKVNPLDITTLSPSEFESADINLLATALVQYAGTTLQLDSVKVDTTTKELDYTVSFTLKSVSHTDMNGYSSFIKNLLEKAKIDVLSNPKNQDAVSITYNPKQQTNVPELKTSYNVPLEIHENYKLALIINSMIVSKYYYHNEGLSLLSRTDVGLVAATARFIVAKKISDEERTSIESYFKKHLEDKTGYFYSQLNQKEIELLEEYFYNVEIKTDYNVLSGNGPRDFENNEIMVLYDNQNDDLLHAVTFGDGIDLILRNHETLPEGTKLLIQKGGQYAGTDQYFTKVHITYPDGALEIFSATNEDGGAVEFNFLKKPKPQFVTSQDEQERLKKEQESKPADTKITEPSNDNPAKGPIVISNLECGEAITDDSFGGLDELTIIQNFDCDEEKDYILIDVKEDGKKVYIKDSEFINTRLGIMNGDVVITDSKFDGSKEFAITLTRGKLTIKNSAVTTTPTLTGVPGPAIAILDGEFYMENTNVQGGTGLFFPGGKSHVLGGNVQGDPAIHVMSEVFLEDVDVTGKMIYTIGVSKDGILTIGDKTTVKGSARGIVVNNGGTLKVYDASSIQGTSIAIELDADSHIEFVGGFPTLIGPDCLIVDNDDDRTLVFTDDSVNDRRGILNRYDCWTKILLPDGAAKAKPSPEVQGPPVATKKKAPVTPKAPAEEKSKTPESTSAPVTTVIKKADPNIKEPGDIIKQTEAAKKTVTREADGMKLTDTQTASGETISAEAAALFSEMATAQKELNRIYADTNKIDNDQYKIVKDAETKLKDDYGINARDMDKFPRAKKADGKTYISWDEHWQSIADNNQDTTKPKEKWFPGQNLKKLVVKIKDLVVKADEEVVIASEEDTVASEADKEKEKVTGVKTEYTKKQRKLFSALGDAQTKINMGDKSNETIAKRNALKQKLNETGANPDAIPKKKGQTMDDVWLDIGKGVDVDKTIEKLQTKVDEYENKKDTSRLYILLDKKGAYHLVSGEQKDVSYEVDADSGYLVIHAEKMTKETLLSVNKEVSKSLLKNILTLNAPWLGQIKIKEDGTIPISTELATNAPKMKIITNSGVYYLEDEVINHWVSAAKEYKKVEELQTQINDLDCRKEWNMPAPTVKSRECDNLAVERDTIYLEAAKKLSKSLLYAKMITEEEYDALINKYEVFLKPDSELTVEEVNQKARILRGAQQLIKPEGKALKLEGLTIEVEPEHAILFKELGQWQKKINDLEKKVKGRDGKYTSDEQKEWAGYVKERDRVKKVLRVDKKDPWVDFFPGKDKETGKTWTRENWWTYLGSTAPEPSAVIQESKPAEFLEGEKDFNLVGPVSIAVEADTTRVDIKVDPNAKKCETSPIAEVNDSSEPTNSTETEPANTTIASAPIIAEQRDQCFYTPACGEYITDSTFDELGLDFGVIVINEDMDCGKGQAIVVNIADPYKAVLVHSAKIEGGTGLLLAKGKVHVYDSSIIANTFSPISMWDGELTIRDSKVITGSTSAGIWHQDGKLTIGDNVVVLGGDIGIWSEDGELKATGKNLKVEATKVAVLIDPDVFNSYSVWTSGFATGDLKANDCLIKTYGYDDILVDNFESYYDRTIDDGGWFGLEFDCWKAKGSVEEADEEELTSGDCGIEITDADFEDTDEFVIKWDIKCGKDATAIIADFNPHPGFDKISSSKTLIIKDAELEGYMGILLKNGNIRIENSKISSTGFRGISMWDGELSLENTEVISGSEHPGIYQEDGELAIYEGVKVKGGEIGLLSEDGIIVFDDYGGAKSSFEGEKVAVLLDASGLLDLGVIGIDPGLTKSTLTASDCLIKTYDLEDLREYLEIHFDLVIDDGGWTGLEFDCYKALGSAGTEVTAPTPSDPIAEAMGQLENMPQSVKDTSLYNRYMHGSTPVFGVQNNPYD